jgi:hypothetical protein
LAVGVRGVRLTILAAFVLVATPAFAVELFRYQGAAKDGGTLEYVFEAGEQNSPNAVTKEKAAEIAADFMTTFYHVQVGTLEHWRLRNVGRSRYRSGSSAFRTRSKGQRATATIVLCRAAAGWDGCCAESGEAVVVKWRKIWVLGKDRS